MQRLFALLLCLCLGACANAPRIATDYKGADAGTVVVGIGTTAGSRYQSYTLLFRRAAAAHAPAGELGGFTYQIKSLFAGQPADYETDDEKGVAVVASLPEGDYEAYGVSVFFNGGMTTGVFTSRQPFSIPFKVSKGHVAYLGNYQATNIWAKNIIGIPIPGGAYFAVESRKDADMGFAARKASLSNGDGTVDFTPDPSKLGNPLLISTAERDRRAKDDD
jgi:hypothetical protein